MFIENKEKRSMPFSIYTRVVVYKASIVCIFSVKINEREKI